MNRPNPDRRGPGHFRPRLEILEDRCLPTVNFTVFGNTLVAFAPTAANQGGDSIIFRDNGSQSPGNVIAISGAAFVPQVAITNVIVLMTGPSESVSYLLTGNLSGTRAVSVSLAQGSDSFAAVVSGNLLAQSSLSFAISAAPSTIHGVPGSALITGTVAGNLQTGANLSWVTATTTSNSTLSFLEAGSIATGANLFVAQIGGAASNNINTFYTGQMNGTLSTFTIGGPKSDNLSTDLEFTSGSSGTLNPSLERGLAGNDSLRFVIHNLTQSVTLNTALVDGGPGNNTDFRTTNVLSFNCQTDNIVP
jgi:hypothetical protein